MGVMQQPNTPAFGLSNTQNRPGNWMGSTNQPTGFNTPQQPTGFGTFGQQPSMGQQPMGIFGQPQNQSFSTFGGNLNSSGPTTTKRIQ